MIPPRLLEGRHAACPTDRGASPRDDPGFGARSSKTPAALRDYRGALYELKRALRRPGRVNRIPAAFNLEKRSAARWIPAPGMRAGSARAPIAGGGNRAASEQTRSPRAIVVRIKLL